MNTNPWVFVVLLLITVSGMALGAFYYLRPEKVVFKRIKKQYSEAARTDVEFAKWLDTEIKSQVSRTRRLGVIIFIFEAILTVFVIGMLLKTLA